MNMITLALQHSKPIHVLRVSLVLLGIVMLFMTPREQYPNIPLYYVHILVPFPGATTSEIEETVTQKIETKVKSLNNITSISSLISDELSYTKIGYDQSISSQEFKNSFLEIQALIANIDMPNGAQTPMVKDITYLDFLATVQLIVYTDKEQPQTQDLETLLNQSKKIQSDLELFDNINTVADRGLISKKIGLYFDNKLLEKYQLSLYEITQAIEKRNLTVPAGLLERGESFLSIKTTIAHTSLESLGDTIIRILPTGIPLYLKDIANIDYYYDRRSELVRYNGYDAVSFRIYRTDDSDAISLVNNLQEYIKDKESNLPEHINLALFADTTVNITNSINTLKSNALLGFVLLFLSLLLFLGWKPALISAVEIPFTFASSFFILSFLGVTLNASTLFALVLVLGMVVDHGIVILENIIRLRHFHEQSKWQAIVQGTSEVSGAVITSSLTTIGAFFPLIFMPGFIGDFLMPIPVTITVTLIVSTISALVIIPIHYMKMPGRDTTHELKIFEWSKNALEYILDGVLHHKVTTCVITLTVISTAVVSLFYLPINLYETEETPFFFVDITFPAGTHIRTSNKIMKELEDVILPLRSESGMTDIVTLIGNTELDIGEGVRFDKPNNAQFHIAVASSVYNTDSLVSDVQRVMDTVKTDKFEFRIRKQRTGPPVSHAIEFGVLGDNNEELSAAIELIGDALQKYDGLYNIKYIANTDIPSLEIHIKEKKLSSYGLNVAQVGTMIHQWVSESSITSSFIDNEQIEIVPLIDNVTEEEKETLSYITFPSPITNTLVPFKKVAEIVPTRKLMSIKRKEGKRTMRITADSSTKENLHQINYDIETLFNNTIKNKYPSLTLQQGGEFDEFFSLLYDILLLLIIGILVVYIILITEFKSYLQPLLIMVTILFTMVGVSAYLLLSNTPLSITVIYSFVALVGVVVNGAIVLINRANQLYLANSITRVEAIIQAAKQRLKPILLTNVTTIFGILPTALGLSGKSPIWQPMAATIGVGLLFSTITTLIVVPAFYVILPNNHKKQKSL